MTDGDTGSYPGGVQPPTASEPAGDQVVVLASSDEAEGRDQDLMSQVEQPAKVMRIGTMIKQLLEEVRAAPLTKPAEPG